MIKKLQYTSITLFATLYLIMSIGVDVSMHYCMGNLKEVKFFTQVEANCCKGSCIIDNSFSCCDNEHIRYQIEDDQLSIENLLKFNNDYQVELPTALKSLPQINGAIELYNKPYFDGDDNSKPSPTYLLNCSFIFYG